MTGATLRATLARLGLSQSGAARMLGVRVTTMQRWCCDQMAMHPAAERLLWACERDPTLVEALREVGQ